MYPSRLALLTSLIPLTLACQGSDSSADENTEKNDSTKHSTAAADDSSDSGSPAAQGQTNANRDAGAGRPSRPSEPGSSTTNDSPTPSPKSDDAGPAGEATEPPPVVPAADPDGDYPILFVTQVPVEGFTSLSSTFGNHRADVQSAPRGGDLMLRYPNGELRNLTQEAGFGETGEQQGANAIAVREPCVHWDATRAVFSMAIGAPVKQYEWEDYYWQLYEVTGLGEGETASISKVKGQPQNYNNVSPIYATNGRDILFTSDRPASGDRLHYPQLDEYESAPTVAGIYRLDPTAGKLSLLEHSPSGAFSLSLDSYGRVLFTKWDHLQQDQQGIPDYSPLTFSDESADATSTSEIAGSEVFPEPREATGNVSGHTFNQFFPWELNEDGTSEETLNHVGRHEFGGTYTDGSFTDDPNLTYYTPEELHENRLMIDGDGGLLHLRENPNDPGHYYATVAPEFYTAGAGHLVLIDGRPELNGDQMTLTAVTAEDDGHYRNPLPLHGNRLVAVYTAETDLAMIEYGDDTVTNYDYRLYELGKDGDLWRAAKPLTDGIEKQVTWWNPDVSYTWSGPLWELDPVEVAPREIPEPRLSELPEPESNALKAAGVDQAELRRWLVDNELALIVMRNVTLRDRGDLNQPFNLRVPNGVEAVATDGKVYDISHLQIFKAEAIRAYDGKDGRRLLARELRDPQFAASDGPQGSSVIAADGSVAAFVPANRALSWQLVDPDGEAVVRERNWISFQAGEIRSCPVCHGLNTASQLGTGVPDNEPQALRDLMSRWL
ncbi:MAG TPA: hypothetical protein VHM70_29140, partial [Polyangiaceae bacterium]|nr:hypothetical protein [Polyangiaceae bacterium]